MCVCVRVSAYLYVQYMCVCVCLCHYGYDILYIIIMNDLTSTAGHKFFLWHRHIMSNVLGIIQTGKGAG